MSFNVAAQQQRARAKILGSSPESWLEPRFWTRAKILGSSQDSWLEPRFWARAKTFGSSQESLREPRIFARAKDLGSSQESWLEPRVWARAKIRVENPESGSAILMFVLYALDASRIRGLTYCTLKILYALSFKLELALLVNSADRECNHI